MSGHDWAGLPEHNRCFVIPNAIWKFTVGPGELLAHGITSITPVPWSFYCVLPGYVCPSVTTAAEHDKNTISGQASIR